MKKEVIIIMLVLILPMISGADFTFKQNEYVNFEYTCLDEVLNTYCNDTFQLLVKITAPNGSTIIRNSSATWNETYFNHSFPTAIIGEYSVLAITPQTNTTSELTYEVTNTGQTLSSGESFLYVAGLFILIILFSLSIFGLFKVDNYVGKFTLFWVSYLLLIGLTFSLWQFTVQYSDQYNAVAGLFKVFFYFIIFAMLPCILLSVAWIVYIHTVTTEMKRLMEKGCSVEEAFSRAKSKRRRK